MDWNGDLGAAIMTTYCSDCRHVYTVNKSDQPWYWLCMRHKRADGYGFVTPDAWISKPPYAYCRDVNLGMCPLFEPLQEQANEGTIHPDS